MCDILLPLFPLQEPRPELLRLRKQQMPGRNLATTQSALLVAEQRAQEMLGPRATTGGCSSREEWSLCMGAHMLVGGVGRVLIV